MRGRCPPCGGQAGTHHLGRGGGPAGFSAEGQGGAGPAGAEAALPLVQLTSSHPAELLGCEELHDLIRLVLKMGNYLNEVPSWGSSWDSSPGGPWLLGTRSPEEAGRWSPEWGRHLASLRRMWLPSGLVGLGGAGA